MIDFSLTTIIDILTLLAIIFAVYKYFRDPDENSRREIELLKQRCKMTHNNIDNDISSIKNNHLEHIEKDIGDLKQSQVKIFTMLEERLPKRK